MEVRVSVFERRVGRQLSWQPLGLGRHGAPEVGPSMAKVRQRLTAALRRRIARLWPAELTTFEAVRGRRLQVVRLELTLRRGGQRVRFAGKVPLIVEPRARGAGSSGPLEIVYHPLRQETWFPHDPERELVEEARAFFSSVWAELADWELEHLKSQDKDRLRLVAFSAPSKSLLGKLLEDEKDPPFALLGAGERERGEALLTRLGTNYTLRAVDGVTAPPIPRSPYREQLQQLLCGRQKSSVLLVGPSGAGKSSVVRQAISDLLVADDHPSHRNLDRVHNVWQIRGRRIIAGMSYLGQWEQRCVDVLDACRKKRGILWVDDVAAWGSIGQTVQSDRSLSTFFRGPLARGELVMVGECTPQGYQRLQDEAPGFAGSFTTLFVEPTGREETLRMLVHEARRYERTFDVSFDPLAFRVICDLGASLGGAAAFPGQALELLHALATREREGLPDLRAAQREIASNKKIAAIKIYRARTGAGLKDSKDAVEFFMAKGYWRPVEGQRRVSQLPMRSLMELGGSVSTPRADVGPADVVGFLAGRTGMPEVLLDAEQPLRASDVADALRGQIMGQEASVVAMRDLVLRLKVGLADRGRPLGVFLFTGPTGTGKTEMAKCVADYLYGDARRLLRFDMSEYSTPDAPARLIGDRFRPDGTLTAKVRAQPFSLVLLDEIEKADPSVLNLMLQLFDDGRLTDAAGRVVDFTHTVVVMTSNLGAKKTPSVGFSESVDDDAKDVAAAIRAFFPPELFNRIDKVVQFGALSAQAARSIARRELDALVQRRGLTERNVFVRYTPAVVERAVREGFRARDGARSLKRYLEQHIGGVLADVLSESRASPVRMLWLHVRDGRVGVHAEHLQEAESYGSSSALEAALGWSGQRLRAEVPAARARAEALGTSEGLATLSRTLSAQVRRVAGGEVAQDAFDLDRLRAEVTQLVDDLQTQQDYDPLLASARDVDAQAEYVGELAQATEFGHQQILICDGVKSTARVLDARHGPSLPLSSRADFLRTLGQLHFLERAVARGGQRGDHAVLIEMTRISSARGASRFAEASAGLLEWLADAYARARGTADQCLVVDRAGEQREVPSSWLSSPAGRTQILLRIVGPAVREFFGPEEGSHVRESVSGGTEVVRVRVLPGVDADPVRHLAGLEAERSAFIESLESTADGVLPEHPDAILPIVRRYVFDPPSPRDLAWLDIEDYPLMYATRTRVRTLADAMPTIWLLRMGAAAAEHSEEQV